jgi:hypothetical protein
MSRKSVKIADPGWTRPPYKRQDAIRDLDLGPEFPKPPPKPSPKSPSFDFSRKKVRKSRKRVRKSRKSRKTK